MRSRAFETTFFGPIVVGMTTDAYTLSLPKTQTTSVVFASPHSGRNYSAEFLKHTILDEWQIRSSEDAFMDMLIKPAPLYGSPLIAAKMPRAYLDLNRSSDELDPAVIEGIKRSPHNPRVASGLGVIPRVVSGGKAIYSRKLTTDEAKARIDGYWHPYHKRLHILMDNTRKTFGEAILIDCHSMPHEAVQSVRQPGLPSPDVVLGDRFGASSVAHVVDQIEQIFVNAGLRVSRNAPFAGAFIAQNYGRPSRGYHAIQIEVDRQLYMNERYIRPNTNFEAFKALMEQVIAQVADLGRKDLPLAAE